MEFLKEVVSLALLLSVVFGDDCPAIYKRYSKEHTGCKSDNPKCTYTNRYISDADKDNIIKLHNQYRSRVANGKETIGNLPSAADMLEMQWDDELAYVAQKHADQCDFNHDCYPCRQVQNFPTVGQNLYEDTDTGKIDWAGAIKNWYDEVKNFDASIIDTYDTSAATGEIGHFSQVIWAKSWKIGCGFSQYKSGNSIKQLYTCNYGPGGNIDNTPVYVKGDPCSKCPNNTSCSKTNPGLCQVDSGKHPDYPPTDTYDYYCNFDNYDACKLSIPEGKKTWVTYDTLSGSYASVVLKGGESTLMNFTTPVPKASEACVSVTYRNGPDLDGQSYNGDAEALAYVQAYDLNSKFGLSRSRNFQPYGLSLGYGESFTFALSFDVPNGGPDQFLEVSQVFFKKGQC